MPSESCMATYIVEVNSDRQAGEASSSYSLSEEQSQLERLFDCVNKLKAPGRSDPGNEV